MFFIKIFKYLQKTVLHNFCFFGRFWWNRCNLAADLGSQRRYYFLNDAQIWLSLCISFQRGNFPTFRKLIALEIRILEKKFPINFFSWIFLIWMIGKRIWTGTFFVRFSNSRLLQLVYFRYFRVNLAVKANFRQNAYFAPKSIFTYQAYIDLRFSYWVNGTLDYGMYPEFLTASNLTSIRNIHKPRSTETTLLH